MMIPISSLLHQNRTRVLLLPWLIVIVAILRFNALYLLESSSTVVDNDVASLCSTTASSNTAIGSDRKVAGNRGKNETLAIVTGFSSNHALEAIAMLKTLIYHGFEGPVYIYLMTGGAERDQEQEDETPWTNQLKQELNKINTSPLTKLRLTVTDMEEKESFRTYCFKSRILAHYFAFFHYNRRPSSTLPPPVIMWTDTSARFQENPTLGAARMVRDSVVFAGRTMAEEQVEWDVPKQTHRGTFSFLNLQPRDFVGLRPIVATFFMMQVSVAEGYKNGPKQKNSINNHETAAAVPKWGNVLDTYIDCGVKHCRTCVAPHPRGDKKGMDEKTAILTGPPEHQYRAHRQDQAVLAVLMYQYMMDSNHRDRTTLLTNNATNLFCDGSCRAFPSSRVPTVALNEKTYLNAVAHRNLTTPYGIVSKLADWYTPPAKPKERR